MAGPTQFVSGETIRWWKGCGDGRDGVYSSAGNATDAPIDSSCSGSATATSLAATNTSFTIGQVIFIHQSRGTGVGQWELNEIAGYTAGTITLRRPLYYTYTDSGASQAQVIVVPQYTNFTQNTGHTLTAKAWNGDVGGIIVKMVKGTLTRTGVVTATGKGFRGGAVRAWTGGEVQAYCGEGDAGASALQSTANGTGGGGGYNRLGASQSGGGGGHSAGGAAGDGLSQIVVSGGGTSGAAALTNLTFGGGGGAGGQSDDGSTAGAGGAGGGLVIFFYNTMTGTGAITANGAAGGTASGGSTDSGSGGGGAGGSVLLKGLVSPLGTTITATAGAGGSDPGNGGAGGAGGTGRIHLDYKVSQSGSSDPAVNVTQDLTLNQPIKRRMIV